MEEKGLEFLVWGGEQALGACPLCRELPPCDTCAVWGFKQRKAVHHHLFCCLLILEQKFRIQKGVEKKDVTRKEGKETKHTKDVM